jgi:peptidoglycan/xylan/chitin deacetylase (PgdA/CDA1 family)
MSHQMQPMASLTHPEPTSRRSTSAIEPTLLQPVPSRWITGLVTDILVRSQVVGLLNKLNGRNGGLILAMHEISAEQLESQLETIAATHTFVPLTELVDRLDRSLPTRGLAAITLDDGPEAITEGAAAIALRRGWPMTFFLPTGSIDRQQPAWYHEIPALLLASSGRTFSVDHRTFQLNGSASIVSAIDALTTDFRALSTSASVEGLLLTLRRALLSADELDPMLQVLRPLTWERVGELARHDELSFEAHSVTHLAMSRLSAVEIEKEMTESRTRIEGVTGRPVQHFCYPYGSWEDIGVVAPKIARRLFRSSVTMSRGRCTRRVDTALLPRVSLYESDTVHSVQTKAALAR